MKIGAHCINHKYKYVCINIYGINSELLKLPPWYEVVSKQLL